MKNMFFFKSGCKRFIISFDEILFMEKDKRKIVLHMREESIIFYGKFKEVLPNLDERFTSPHKSYLFNMHHIRFIGKTEVILTDGEKIGMCRICIGKCRKAFDEYYLAEKLAKRSYL